MAWEILTAASAVSTVVGIAVWRFSRVENSVKNLHTCQRTLVKGVSRLNANHKTLRAALHTHVKEEQETLDDILARLES